MRSGGGLPLLETLANHGIPAISTGFAVESEANMHGPNECFQRAHVEPGIATVAELLAELG